jgi:hypothetical protein
MGKLLFGMMQSLDGYMVILPERLGVPELPPPDPELHRPFNDHVRGLAGILYGRYMYEVMRWPTSNSGAPSSRRFHRR